MILKPQATRPSIQHHSLSLEEASSDSEFVALFRQQHSQAISKSINEDTSTPMWKVCLFNPPSGSKEGLRMSLSLNHSIYDAFAVRALMQDLDSILSESPRPSSSPPIADILQEIGISNSKEHREFWIEHLEGLKPILEARPPKTPTSNESTRLSRQFSIPFADIRSFCSEAGVTTQSFFNAAFALAGREMFGWDESGSALFGVSDQCSPIAFPKHLLTDLSSILLFAGCKKWSRSSSRRNQQCSLSASLSRSNSSGPLSS